MATRATATLAEVTAQLEQANADATAAAALAEQQAATIASLHAAASAGTTAHTALSAQLNPSGSQGHSGAEGMAAATAAAAAAAAVAQGSTYARESFKTTQFFHGDVAKDNDLTARAWLNYINVQLLGQNVAPHRWVSSAANGLRGSANIWYLNSFMNSSAGGVEISNPFPTWTVFKAALCAQFMLTDDLLPAFSNLNNTVQGKADTIQDYFQSFTAAQHRYAQAGGDLLDPRGTMLLFQQNLLPRARGWIAEAESQQRLTNPSFAFRDIPELARHLRGLELVRRDEGGATEQQPRAPPRRDYGGYTEPAGERPVRAYSAYADDGRNSDSQQPRLEGTQDVRAQPGLLTTAERDRRQRESLCFRCGKPWDQDHRASCPGRLAAVGRRAKQA